MDHWLPDQGNPAGRVHLRIDADAATPQPAYDFWCETACDPAGGDATRLQQGGVFSSSLEGLTSARGGFYVYQAGVSAVPGFCRSSGGEPGDRPDDISDDNSGLQRSAALGEVDISMVIKGRHSHRLVQVGEERPVIVQADPSVQMAWPARAGLHLSLRAAEIEAMPGQHRLPATAVLSRSPVSPFLKAQLHLLAERASDMDSLQRAMVLDSTIDLALVALRDVLSEGGGKMPAGGLFATACRLVDIHLGNPALDAQAIARRLGCSRATLYRVFAARGASVAAYIRERRLQRVWALLRSQPPGVPIAEIARRCGFLDSSSFSRLFRCRFGVRARDVRARR